MEFTDEIPNSSEFKNEDVTNVPEKASLEANADTPETTASVKNRHWNDRETLLLIQVYSEYQIEMESSSRKIDVWEAIVNRINSFGYSFTASNCRNRWKHLYAEYRKAKVNGGKSLNGRKSCPFYSELDLIFGDNALEIQDSSSYGSAAPSSSYKFGSSLGIMDSSSRGMYNENVDMGFSRFEYDRFNNNNNNSRNRPVPGSRRHSVAVFQSIGNGMENQPRRPSQFGSPYERFFPGNVSEAPSNISDTTSMLSPLQSYFDSPESTFSTINRLPNINSISSSASAMGGLTTIKENQQLPSPPSLENDPMIGKRSKIDIINEFKNVWTEYDNKKQKLEEEIRLLEAEKRRRFNEVMSKFLNFQ